MELRQIFQSLIALHQAELPYDLHQRLQILPTNREGIITVSGVRRCGKSSLLKLVANAIVNQGIARERILMVGFDDERFSGMTIDQMDEVLQAYRDMFPQQSLKEVYMFFDEIQLIEGWELFAMRVYKNYCKHIYITGSTSQMLSEEMASALRGWPIEVREYPLSFAEYLEFRNAVPNPYTEEGVAQLKDAFRRYCLDGGFPQVALEKEQSVKTQLLQNYFNTMLFRDMIEHYSISTNSFVVRYFLKRVMANLTKPTSINNIYNDLKSQGHKVSKDALYQWIDYACNVFLFHAVPRYTKSLAKESASQNKYYVCDHGLRNAVLLPQSDEEGKVLENIVFYDMLRTLSAEDRIFYYRGVGECDFVVQRDNNITDLVQVCWHLTEENENREINGLIEASRETGCSTCTIVTFEQSQTIERNGLHISVIPVWRALSKRGLTHPSVK